MKNKNLIFIDASNIGSGGGINHLIKVLEKIPDSKNNIINECTVWASKSLADKLPKKKNLIYKNSVFFSLPQPLNFIWNIFIFRLICCVHKPNYLYCPGGLLFFKHKNSTLFFQNVLPFLDDQINRYSYKMRFKWLLLRKLQIFASNNATKHVFLTQNSYEVIKPFIFSAKKIEIISHGIDKRFIIDDKKRIKRREILRQKVLEKKEINFVYVASAERYKNHFELIKSFEYIHTKDTSFNLTLIISNGSIFDEVIDHIQNSTIRKFINLKLNLELDEVIYYLHNSSDVCVFASSCESFGQILLEGMSSGMPIFALKESCIPEILKQDGFYFNFKNYKSLYNAISNNFNNFKEVERIAFNSWENSKKYSWKECSDKTWKLVLQNEK